MAAVLLVDTISSSDLLAAVLQVSIAWSFFFFFPAVELVDIAPSQDLVAAVMNNLEIE